ncbi:MAG TPA: ABC transporter permease [Lysobacter sp.]
MLGWHDIRQRYRRSLIGPFWLTISTGVMVLALGILYAGLFKFDVSTYLPYLGVGLITWSLISTVINESGSIFVSSEQMVRQIKLPFSLHVHRMIWRNVIIFGHNCIIYVAILFYFKFEPGINVLYVIPGFTLLLINLFWVALLLGLLSARFRDIPQIVSSLMQVVFFLTPIMWLPDLLTSRPAIVELNPFHHMIELVRAPLLGKVPDTLSWTFSSIVAVGGWTVVMIMFSRYRRRIPYWV